MMTPQLFPRHNPLRYHPLQGARIIEALKHLAFQFFSSLPEDNPTGAFSRSIAQGVC